MFFGKIKNVYVFFKSVINTWPKSFWITLSCCKIYLDVLILYKIVWL